MPIRNIPAESQAAKDFTLKYGRQPESTQDLALVTKMAYPTINDLPDDQTLRSPDVLSLYQSGVQAAPPKNPQSLTLDQQQQQSVNSLQGDVAAAKVGYQQAGQQLQQNGPVQATGQFQGIQQAIKTAVGSQDESNGVSDLYQAAGLNGFESLHQALAQKSTDLNEHKARLDNILGQVGDMYRAQIYQAKQNWDIAKDTYDTAVNRADAALKDMVDHERQIQLVALQSKVQRDLEEYKRSHPSVQDQLNLLNLGYTLDSKGNVIPQTSSVTDGYDLSGIAQKPEDVKAFSDTKKEIGLLPTDAALDAEVKKLSPDGKVTAQMIKDASAKYQLPWEDILALVSHADVKDASVVDHAASYLAEHKVADNANDAAAEQGIAQDFASHYTNMDVKAAFLGQVKKKVAQGDLRGAKEYILTSAIERLPAADQSKVTGAKVALLGLQDIQKDIEDFQKTSGNNMGLLSGTSQQVQEKLGATGNPKLAALGTKIFNALIQYVHAGAGGRISAQEIPLFEATFPTIKGSVGLNAARLGALEESLDTYVNAYLGAYIGPDSYKKLMQIGTDNKTSTDILDTHEINTPTDPSLGLILDKYGVKH